MVARNPTRKEKIVLDTKTQRPTNQAPPPPPPPPPVSPAFEVHAMDAAGARVVWCRGELDIAAEEAVMRTVATALGKPSTNMILDLREVTFADCSVIRVIEYADAACARCQVSLYVDIGDVVRNLVATLEPELLGAAKPYLTSPGGP